MSNIDKAIQQAEYDLLMYLKDNVDDYTLAWQEGWVNALRYVKNEMDWITK